MTRRAEWILAFLGVTFTAVGMEIYAVADGKSYTQPWTDLLVGFLPAGVGIPLVIGFSIWLCVHFISRWLGHPVAITYDDRVSQEMGEMDNGQAPGQRNG